MTLKAFTNVTSTVNLTGHITNKCSRVFIYHEKETLQITVGVLGATKQQNLGTYISYLDYYLLTNYGYSALKENPICGFPNVRIRCLNMGEISTMIVEAIDFTLFTPAFLVSLQDDALYIPETPAFLQYVTSASRETSIMVQALKDIYLKPPYMCNIEPYFSLDPTW